MITANQITDYRATANSILADDCDPELTIVAGMILTLCHAIDAMRKPVTYFFYDPSEFAWDAIKYFASLDEAVAACNKAIQDMNDGNWGMDEEDLERFIVGTVTHKAKVHKHVCTLEESESGAVDAAPGTEIWECKLEAVQP